MALDKALILKGLAGVTAVGSMAVGGVVFKKKLGLEGLFFPSGEASDRNEEQGASVPQQQPQQETSNKNPASPGPQASGDGGLAQVSEVRRDERGLPENCETSKNCELTAEDLKKIKFKDLEDVSEGNVEVNPSSGTNVTLTIKGSGEQKRYIFENGGSGKITLSKGGASVDLPVGKSRFVEKDNKLETMETGDYGLPKKCITSQSCTLIDDDLGMVKFSGFTGVGESTVEGIGNGSTISFTKENDTYIFNAPAQVTITNGETTVNLGQGETEFKVSDQKLKRAETWDFGLPEDCKPQDDTNPKTCSLTTRDLKKIKFKVNGADPTIGGLNGNEKVTLEIVKAQDASHPDNRKYTFTPGGSSNVTISYSGSPEQTITFEVGGSGFRKDNTNDILVAIPKRQTPTFSTTELDGKLNTLGFPEECRFEKKAEGAKKSIECELTKDELKNLKFSRSSNGEEITISTIDGDDRNFGVKIEEIEDEDQFKTQKVRVTFPNREVNDTWNKDLTISGDDGEPLIIYRNSDTEFRVNDKSRLQKAWGVLELSGLVGLECGSDASSSDCSMKSTDGTIKVYLDGAIKEFKPSNSSQLGLTFEEDKDGYGQGIKFKFSSQLGGTVDNESKTLDSGDHEIRRVNGKNWALVRYSSTNIFSLGG